MKIPDPFDLSEVSAEDDIYKENILDLFKHPRNTGKLDHCDILRHEKNTSCGDEITLYVVLDKDKKIKDVRHMSKGCAISQASISMLTDHIKGKSLKEIKAFREKDVLDLLGISVGPFRMKCAMLGLKALEHGIHEYETR